MDKATILFGGAALGFLIRHYWPKRSNYSINNKLNQIMENQAAHAQQLRDLTAQNEKAHAEHLAAIAALETALANAGNTTPEVDEAFAALKASIQKDDDLTPDAAPEA